MGKKTGPNPTDRGKLGTKRSVVTDARGIPIGFAVAGANVPDYKLLEATLDAMPVQRLSRDNQGENAHCLARNAP